MTDREDRIEDWIRGEEEKAVRRSSVVPPSSEQIYTETPSEGEAAMVALSEWMSSEPDLPLVELAVMSTEVIQISFGAPVELPDPFESVDQDAPVVSDTWRIGIDEALTLESGGELSEQMTALTGIGNTVEGAQCFVNLTRWGCLGIAGTPEWVHKALLSQIMVQAAQMWSQEQHLWLVGMGETAQKLITLLRAYHPEELFHVVDEIEEITAADIEGTSATIYVLGSDDRTHLKTTSQGLTEASLVTDSVVNPEAMFISESEDGAILLAPTDHILFPNVVDDILELLELTWDQAQKIEQQAKEEAESADYDELLRQAHEDSETSSAVQIDEDVDAAFAEIMGQSGISTDIATPLDSDDSDDAAEETEEAETDETDEAPTEDEAGDQEAAPKAEELADSDASPDENLIAAPEASEADEEDEANEEDEEESETVHAEEPTQEPTQEPTEESSAAPSEAAEDQESKASEPAPQVLDDAAEAPSSEDEQPEAGTDPVVDGLAETPHLCLLGGITHLDQQTRLDGRHAETVALLHLAGKPVPVQEVSAAIWPEDEAEGRTARTRRSRLLAKIREQIEVTVDDGTWLIRPQQTDIDVVLGSLSSPEEDPSTLISACHHVAPPLSGAGPWAEEHQKALRGDLTDVLQSLVDDHDDPAVQEAAQQALRKVGE